MSLLTICILIPVVIIGILVAAEFALWTFEKLISTLKMKDVTANPSKSEKMD